MQLFNESWPGGSNTKATQCLSSFVCCFSNHSPKTYPQLGYTSILFLLNVAVIRISTMSSATPMLKSGVFKRTKSHCPSRKQETAIFQGRVLQTGRQQTACLPSTFWTMNPGNTELITFPKAARCLCCISSNSDTIKLCTWRASLGSESNHAMQKGVVRNGMSLNYSILQFCIFREPSKQGRSNKLLRDFPLLHAITV